MRHRFPSRTALTLAAAVVAAIGISLPAHAQSDTVTITIQREKIGKAPGECTYGTISVNGTPFGYSLERPFEGNISLISSIPAGSYAAAVKERPGATDTWRIQLLNTKDRKNVQIHVGNTLADTLGCILVGETLKPDKCNIQNSKAAYTALKKALERVRFSLDAVKVVIKDPP